MLRRERARAAGSMENVRAIDFDGEGVREGGTEFSTDASEDERDGA